MKIDAKTISSLNIREGTVLILKVPAKTSMADITDGVNSVVKASEVFAGITPGVLVLPFDYDIEKMDILNLKILRMRIDSLLAYHVDKIERIKNIGDA